MRKKRCHVFMRVEFAEKKRNHERGLQRTHTGAGVIDADHAGAEFDHVIVCERNSADGITQRDGDQRIGPHQILHERLLDLRRPGNRDEKKRERKTEMAQPIFSAAEIDNA